MFPSPTPHDEAAPSFSPATSQATTAVHEMLASFFQQPHHSIPAGATIQMIPTAAMSPMNPQQQLTAEAMAKAAVSASFLAFLQQTGCPPPLAQPQPQQTPTYVNAKQYQRILKRRQTRSILDEHYKCQIQRRQGKQNQSFQHESRHRHAVKRPRDAHGRFLNGQALRDYYEQHPEEEEARQREAVETKRIKTLDEPHNLLEPLSKKIKNDPQYEFSHANPETKSFEELDSPRLPKTEDSVNVD